MKKIALRTRKIPLLLAALVATASSLLLQTEPARAQVPRTWVSGTGDDSNSTTGCQQSAPCLSFSTALSVTQVGGEVNCMNPNGLNGFGTPLNITFSVTIDCHDVYGSIGANGTNAIVINAGTGVVNLRNLNLDGFVVTSEAAGLNGITIEAAAVVNIEDCVIQNFSQRGIDDIRTGGGTKLFIKNTVVRNNTGAGIVVAAAGTNSVALENVQSVDNTYGIAVATGNHVTISRSMMFGNATAGVEADAGGQVYVDNTEIANNGTGVEAFGNVALGNSGIVSNSTGISGTTTSYGNNRIFANSSAGTAPTLIGAVSPDYGQQ